MRPARTVAVVVVAVLAALIPAPTTAQPASACSRIPPVHHRIHGDGDHREGDGLENTKRGLRMTYRDGGRWYETDAQVLKDRRGRPRGPVVAFHDFTTPRTTTDTPETSRVLRNLRYRDLPLTTAGQRIPKLGELVAWLARHRGTHLLVEVKMMLPWGRIVRLLKRYGFDGTRRVLFDIGGAGPRDRKHDVAVAMKERLGPYVVTGLKRWPGDRPAEYLRRYGRGIRLDLDQGINRRRELVRAGMTVRFLKVMDGGPVLWRRAVESGAFTHIITERTKAYLGWCAQMARRMVRRNR